MSESISIKITPPPVEVPTSKAVVFLNRKFRRAKKFKKNHFVICTFLPAVFLLAGQLYLFPALGVGAPTDLDKFPLKTQESICKRICMQGYASQLHTIYLLFKIFKIKDLTQSSTSC